jgi:threonine synthase
VIRKYRDFLPVGEDRWIVSLNEGWTPLIKARRLREVLQREIDVYLKYEGLNPTGSFKDRGMTVAVSKALEEVGYGPMSSSPRERSPLVSFPKRCSMGLR